MTDTDGTHSQSCSRRVRTLGTVYYCSRTVSCPRLRDTIGDSYTSYIYGSRNFLRIEESIRHNSIEHVRCQALIVVIFPTLLLVVAGRPRLREGAVPSERLCGRARCLSRCPGIPTGCGRSAAVAEQRGGLSFTVGGRPHRCD